MFSFQKTLVFPLESTLTFRYPLNVNNFYTDFSSWCLSADVGSLEMVVYSSLDRWDMPQGATVPFSRLDFQDKVRLATLGSNTLPRTAPLGTVVVVKSDIRVILLIFLSYL